MIGKGIVIEWPRMPFAPEAIHKSVNKLDDRVAIEFRRQLTNQFLECLLKKRMVIPGLILRMWIVQKSLAVRFAGRIAQHQIDFRHFFEDKIRQRRFVLIVGRAHLNSQSNPLVVLLRQFKNLLQVVGHLQASRPRLHFPPRGANVKLLAQGESDQVLNRLGNIVGLDFLGATISRDVSDQPLTIIRNNVIGWSCAHHHIIRGNHGIGRVLRKRPLIEAIVHCGTGAKIAASPVVSGNDPLRFADSKFSSHCNCDTTFQKISALHWNYVLIVISIYSVC